MRSEGEIATKTLQIVAPCFNEEEALPTFVTALLSEMSNIEAISADLRIELILVDDGSSDATAAKIAQTSASDPRVRGVFLSRNFGHQIAISAGMDAAKDAGADAIVVMDSDMQHPPTLIAELVEEWRRGHDVVMAVRRQSAGTSFFKRVSSRAFYTFFNLLSDTKIESGAADFYLLSRVALNALGRMTERRRFLRGMVHWIGFSRTYVHYDSPPRVAGESKYSLRRMIRFAVDAVFSFSARPIRIATRIGVATAGLGAIYLGYVLGRAWFIGDLVAGWGSLISVVLILGGLQLMFIGMIGEYVSRIFEESKARPLYLTREVHVENDAIAAGKTMVSAAPFSQDL